VDSFVFYQYTACSPPTCGPQICLSAVLSCLLTFPLKASDCPGVTWGTGYGLGQLLVCGELVPGVAIVGWLLFL
jgi:hypothetical protein